MSTILRIILIPITIIIAIFGCLALATSTASLYRAYKETLGWRRETAPLSIEVAQDLCHKFSLSADNKFCDQKKVVYAPDFFEIIDEAFLPGISTYEDVQEVLSSYQTELEPMVTLGDGTQYFRSIYDLQGDNVTGIIFFFYNNGKLMKIVYKTSE